MASVVINGDTSGSVTLSAPAVAGTTTLTLPATSGTILQSGTAVTEAQGGTGTTTGYYGFKNRIINGSFVLDQRNAGASITPANVAYTLDRWAVYQTTASKFTVQQNAGSITPPAGFTKYLGCTSSSAYSVTSGDIFGIYQLIEGNNVLDLAWGTANAKTVTLSFLVYSSLTGTFGGVLTNNSQTRSYPFTYSIPVANTWTTISITIAGDTTGTWETGTSIGINVILSIGSGSTRNGTAGAWSGSAYYSATGTTSVVGTNGATFYITGVQLEKGSTATSFDYRPYGTEYDLCRRYFEQWNFSNTGSATVNQYIGLGQGYSSTDGRTVLNYYPKRAQPSCAVNGGGLRFSTSGGGATGTSGWAFDQPGPIAVLLYNSSLTGITQGYSYHVVGTAAGNITFNAEL